MALSLAMASEVVHISVCHLPVGDPSPRVPGGGREAPSGRRSWSRLGCAHTREEERLVRRQSWRRPDLRPCDRHARRGNRTLLACALRRDHVARCSPPQAMRSDLQEAADDADNLQCEARQKSVLSQRIKEVQKHKVGYVHEAG